MWQNPPPLTEEQMSNLPLKDKMITRGNRISLALARLALCAGVLAAAGCAGTAAENASGSAEEQVQARAQARWNAALAQDFEKSYSYTAPSYRALTDFRLYKAQKAGEAALISAKIVGVKCENENSCAAKVRIEFHAPLMGGYKKDDTIVTHYDEKWIKEDGKWWLFLQ